MSNKNRTSSDEEISGGYASNEESRRILEKYGLVERTSSSAKVSRADAVSAAAPQNGGSFWRSAPTTAQTHTAHPTPQQQGWKDDPFGYLLELSKKRKAAEPQPTPYEGPEQTGRGNQLVGGQRAETIDSGRLSPMSGAPEPEREPGEVTKLATGLIDPYHAWRLSNPAPETENPDLVRELKGNPLDFIQRARERYDNPTAVDMYRFREYERNTYQESTREQLNEYNEKIAALEQEIGDIEKFVADDPVSAQNWQRDINEKRTEIARLEGERQKLYDEIDVYQKRQEEAFNELSDFEKDVVTQKGAARIINATRGRLYSNAASYRNALWAPVDALGSGVGYAFTIGLSLVIGTYAAAEVEREGGSSEDQRKAFVGVLEKGFSAGDAISQEYQNKYKEIDEQAARGAYWTNVSKEGLGVMGKLGIDLYQGMLDQAMDRAIGFIVPGGYMASMLTRSFGSGAMNARQQGADTGAAILYGLKDATIEWGTEKIFGIGHRGAYEGWFDGWVSRGVDRFIARGGPGWLAKMAAGFGTEGLEEMLGYMMGASTDWALKTWGGDGFSWVEPEFSFEDMLYDFMVGGLLGAFGSLFSSGRSSMNNARAFSQEEFIRQFKRAGEVAFTLEVSNDIIDSANSGDYSRVLGQIINNPVYRKVYQDMFGKKLPKDRVEAAKKARLDLESLREAANEERAKDNPARDDRGAPLHLSPYGFASGAAIDPNEARTVELPSFTKEPVTSAQSRLARIFNEAGGTSGQLSAADALNLVGKIRNSPSLEAAFVELTGMQLDDYRASIEQSPQNDAGAQIAPAGQMAPEPQAEAPVQAPAQLNSENNAVESGEQGFSDYLYGWGEDERGDYLGRDLEEWPSHDAELARRLADQQKEAVQGRQANTGVDFLLGDQYNPSRGQQVRYGSDLSRDAYIEQAKRDDVYSGEDWYDDVIDTAIRQIREDPRNAGRIADGQGEWASYSPAQRAEILRDATGRNYYVSGREVVRGKYKVESDTDQRSEHFYEQELRDANIKPISKAETQEAKEAHNAIDKKHSDSDAPRAKKSNVDGYTQEELSIRARQSNAESYRRAYEAWLTTNNIDMGQLPLRGGLLGEPRIDSRSIVMQSVMRDADLLADLVNGTGRFKGFSASSRLDMLRSIYPDANWQFDGKTNTISLPGAEYTSRTTGKTKNFDAYTAMHPLNPSAIPQSAAKSERAFEWKLDETKQKKTVTGEKARNGGFSVATKKSKGQGSRGPSGTQRRIGREALIGEAQRRRVRDSRNDATSSRNAGKDGKEGGRGAEQPGLSAAPLVKDSELAEWKNGIAYGEDRGMKYIGTLTESMARANAFLNKFGFPCTHADASESSTATGGWTGTSCVYLAWGKGATTRNHVVVHELMHALFATKFGDKSAGTDFFRSALKRVSIDPSVIKKIGESYRSVYQEKYAQSWYGKSFSELEGKQKRNVENLVGAEIYGDLVSGHYGDTYRNAGMTLQQFETLHKACLDAAVEGKLISPEERGWIEDFLNKPLQDDYRKELIQEKNDLRAKRQQYEESHQESEYEKVAKAKKNPNEYTYTPGSQGSPKLRAGINENVKLEGSVSTSQMDVDKSAQERWYEEHPNSEGAAWRASQSFSNYEESGADSVEKYGAQPESSAEYIEQTRLTKKDFDRRERERYGDQAEFEREKAADEAQFREEASNADEYEAHRAAEEQQRIDAEDLAAAKKAYGEKNHEKMVKTAEKLNKLVGSSRVQSSGISGHYDAYGQWHAGVKGDVREAFSYNEGGKHIEAFAKTFDAFTKGKASFAEVADAYHEMNRAPNERTGGYFYDDAFGKTMDDLKAMYNEGKVINKDGSLNQKFASQVEELSKRIAYRFELKQNELKTREDLTKPFDVDQEVLRGRRAALKVLLEGANRFQLRPSTAFRRMADYDAKTGKAYYDLARLTETSVRNYINTFQTAQDYMQGLTQHKDWEAFSRGKIKVDIVIPGLHYKGGKISLNAALSFLKILETEGSMGHIISSGKVQAAYSEEESYSGMNNKGFGSTDNYAKVFDPLSKETRDAITEAKRKGDDFALEEAEAQAERELRALKNKLRQQIESTEIGKMAYEASFDPLYFLKLALNKTSRTVWGTNVAEQNKFYWPLETMKKGGVELLNAPTIGLDTNSIVQSRTGESGGLVLRPFTEVMQGYIRTASHWAAYEELSDKLHTLSQAYTGTESITDLLSDKLGTGWATWLKNYEDDLNGKRGKERSIANRIFGSLRSNVAQSSLLLNGSVALKQAPSGLDFMGFLDADIVAKHFLALPFRSARSFGKNALIQELEGGTRMLANRRMGYNLVETGEKMESGRGNAAQRLVGKVPGWISNWITKTDYRTVANGMLACADQVDRWIKNGKDGYANLKKGTDDYDQAVIELFENAVINTQPIYNKEFRADAMRTDNEILRSLTMFRTQQTQNYNNLVESIGELQALKRSGGSATEIAAARKRVVGTIAGQVSSAFMFALLDGVAKLLLPNKWHLFRDDEDEFSWGLFGARSGYSFLNSLVSTSWLGSMVGPFALDQITKFANKHSGGKIPESGLYYGTEESALGLINSAYQAFDAFTDKPGLSTGTALAYSLAAVFGIPLKNAHNLVNAVVMYGLQVPGLRGIDYEHSDDYIRLLDRYFSAKPADKGRQTMRRALTMIDKGSDKMADLLLGTLDSSDELIIEAAKKELTNSFVTGAIDSSTYRRILRNYFDMNTRDIDKLIGTGNEKREFDEAVERAEQRHEGAEATFKKIGKLDSKTDPSYEMRFDLISKVSASDKDTDLFVNRYMPKTYRDAYKALRGSGLSPRRANAIIQAIDTDTTADHDFGFSQAELYEYGRQSEANRRSAQRIWNISGYKKTWDEYDEEYRKNPVNILVRHGADSGYAERMWKGVDADGSGGIDQKELYSFYKSHRELEGAVREIWANKGWKTSFDDYAKKHG